MTETPIVTRESILQTLIAALRPLPFVDAMWEGGAAAFHRLDEWSDVDLYVVAADDCVPETFRAVDEALERLSPIRLKYEPSWPPESGITQAFYRLEGASEYLLVDLAVLKRSAPDKFLEREIHGDAVFAFSKGDAIRIPPMDVNEFVRKLTERRDRLARRVELFASFVPKEIHRHNWLGALEAYERIVLDALIQALRMRDAPAHYGFSVRYVYYELAPDVVRRLEELAFVHSPEELETKAQRAAQWFRETVAEVTEDRVRSALRGPGAARIG